MVTAPFCNVEIAKPPGKPHSPKGLTPIPPGTPLNKALTIINNNFNLLAKGNFIEDRALRQTTLTRIFDPSDHSVFVDVRQITGAVFVNQFTGQAVIWHQ